MSKQVIEFWEKQIEKHECVIKELERMWNKKFDEMKECEDDYPNLREMFLNQMRDYTTAIKRNETSIKKIKKYIQIASLRR